MHDKSAPTTPTPIVLSGVDEREPPLSSLSGQLTAFLDGRTHGEEFLHTLYDWVLDEPIPARMRAILTTH